MAGPTQSARRSRGLREVPLGAGSVPGCGLWGEGPARLHFLSFPGAAFAAFEKTPLGFEVAFL